MKNSFLSRILVTACLAFLWTTAAWSGGFSLFGSYLDFDEPDGALGVGVRFEMDLTSHWTLDFTASIYEETEVVLRTDAVDFEIDEEVTFVPYDVGVRYHFGDSDGFAPYLGGGYSYLQLEADTGEGRSLDGLYGVVGVRFGDDVGPRIFAEALIRRYEDLKIDLLFDELGPDSSEFPVEGFSVAAGVRWRFGR